MSDLTKLPPIKLPALAVKPPARTWLRIPMTCSARGVPFIGLVGRDRNGNAILTGAEKLRRGSDARTGEVEVRAFTYGGAVRDWNCPVCGLAHGALDAFSCIEPGCRSLGLQNILHCGGRTERRQHCACGQFVEWSTTRGSLTVAAERNCRAQGRRYDGCPLDMIERERRAALPPPRTARLAFFQER